MFQLGPRKLVTREQALPGHDQRLFDVPDRHAVLGTPLEPPFPDDLEIAYVGDGLLLGSREEVLADARRVLHRRRLPGRLHDEPHLRRGVHRSHRATPRPSRSCSTRSRCRSPSILTVFWENHDPTQGFRQGNDTGTQYRSAIYTTTPEQAELVEVSRDSYQRASQPPGYRDITTEIRPAHDAGPFYFAEAYHQQYLHKVPNGYCGIGGTGVSCPVGMIGVVTDD